MTTTTTTTIKATTVDKGGDWVKPIVTAEGVTVYAIQINKTQADKDNFAEIYKAYADKGVEVYTYNGKGDKPVYLVDATQRIKATRANASTDKLVASAVAMFGVTEEQARAMVANAKK